MSFLDTTELRENAIAAMDVFHVPGVAIGVSHEDTYGCEVLGVTNLDHPLDVTLDTFFRVHSITKTLVATAALRLVAQGELQLDTPVRHHLPELELQDDEATQSVTLRHLLTHSGGWWDTPKGDIDDPLSRMPTMLSETIQRSRPGQVWSYCNSGFMLVGCLLERVLGQPFEATVRDLVLAPLEMSCSYFDPSEIVTRRVAAGHTIEGVDPEGDILKPLAGRVVVVPWGREPRWWRPSIGLATTLSDLRRYLEFHLTGLAPSGSELLPADVRAELYEPQMSDGQVGLSWFIDRIANEQVISLGGGGSGYGVFIVMVPSRRFGLIVLTNIAGHAFDRTLTRWAMKHYLNLSDEAAHMTMTNSQLREYVGHYTGEHQEIDVVLNRGSLELLPMRKTAGAGGAAGRPPVIPRIPLSFVERDRAVVSEGPRKDVRAQFIRGAKGNVTMLRFPTLLYVRDVGV